MQGRAWTDWQFTREDLKRTPSVSCGWTVEREELDRAKACGLIYSASRKLQLPQITSTSACVFLHRFFMRHTLKEYHHYNIAATCLFFACKAEETLRKLDDFIPVIVYYASKGIRKAPPGTSEFEKWRAVILRNEIVLLQALCFDMVIDHPHTALIDLSQLLSLNQPLSQMAWSFIADCMRLPLCLVYPPKSIAYASLSLAIRVASSDVRGSLDDAWLDRISANRTEVSEIVQWVLEFYAREAQSRQAHGSSDHNADVSPTPASSPGSTTSPMPHVQQSPSETK
ncbi:cyclin-like protein [Martensiomyces pterosporus]|nr:cyclin-like protein [Martensiomyces pterosporus]